MERDLGSQIEMGLLLSSNEDSFSSMVSKKIDAKVLSRGGVVKQK